ncbi:hypothetical protein ACP275_07G089400 [Erythranthe tilingii]
MERDKALVLSYIQIFSKFISLLYIHTHTHVCVCIVPGIPAGRRFLLLVLPFFKKVWEGLMLLPNSGEGRKSGAAESDNADGGRREGAERWFLERWFLGGEKRADGGRREGAERWFLGGKKREG